MCALPFRKCTRINVKGLRINVNGVVSMRDLELASRVPPKTTDIGAKRFFNASLTLSKAFTVACFIVYGKHMPVEKLRVA